MRWNEIITEGADLRCSHCGENLGKATENYKSAYCGNCGQKTHNPKGSDPELDEASDSMNSVLGQHIPDWSISDDAGEYLVFDNNKGGVAKCYRSTHAKYIANVDNRYDLTCNSTEELAKKLTASGHTIYQGYEKD